MSKELISVNVYEDLSEVVYKIAHCDTEKQTTLRELLNLHKTPEGWKASMDFDEMEHQKTITASAWKLAEWFERMAEEIKKTEFDSVNFNNL